MLRLHRPGGAARRKASGHLLAVHEKGARPRQASNHIRVLNGRSHHRAVWRKKRDGSCGITRESVDVERNVIVKLSEARAKNRPPVRQWSKRNAGAWRDAQAVRQPLMLHPSA